MQIFSETGSTDRARTSRKIPRRFTGLMRFNQNIQSLDVLGLGEVEIFAGGNTGARSSGLRRP